MKLRRLLSALGLAALTASSAFGQSTFPTQSPNISATGAVAMCLDFKGVAVPCSGLSSLPVRIVGGLSFPPYPPLSFPITGNAAGTTGAVVGTLAAAPGKTTYICGFNVSAIGGTAAVSPITIAGLTGSSMVYQLASSAGGVTSGLTFTPCIPAATLNTAITITTTADGTATAVNVNSWGFQL